MCQWVVCEHKTCVCILCAHHIQHHIHSQAVRVAIIQTLPCTADTLPLLLERTLDVSEDVRAAVYTRLHVLRVLPTDMRYAHIRHMVYITQVYMMRVHIYGIQITTDYNTVQHHPHYPLTPTIPAPQHTHPHPHTHTVWNNAFPFFIVVCVIVPLTCTPLLQPLPLHGLVGVRGMCCTCLHCWMCNSNQVCVYVPVYVCMCLCMVPTLIPVITHPQHTLFTRLSHTIHTHHTPSTHPSHTPFTYTLHTHYTHRYMCIHY